MSEAVSSSAYHEPVAELSPAIRDLHRALASVREELEAIDWYQQRVAASHDEALVRVLEHNLEEEIEHAVLGIEWIRCNLPAFDACARRLLFGGARDAPAPADSLGIGGLR